ncbi:MAG: tetraacyldisaccharide 4'-kinase [bacterium]|nr:tetraacyldisaccharide 4'-kinase [bacterium]
MILGAAARVRRVLYSTGLLPASRLPRPVVSVGNLVMGGAGKTPHVIHLARWLAGQGRRVGVLSRGYGRKSSGVRWVSDGEGPIVTAAEGGDEPVLIARSLPGIPVAVGESRAAAGREILSRRAVDVFLLDDGFQHLSLRRDVDLLLVECGRGLGNRMTAPLGPLREPPSHARFADALVITKCPDAESGARTARSVPFPPVRPRAFSRLTPGGIVGRDGLPSKVAAVGESVFAFSGLARNGQYRDTLETAGFRVEGFLPFPDHHAYGREDLDRIARAAGGLPAITTEKDLVRLPDDVPFPVGALRVDVEYLDGWEEISRMILDRLEGGSRS